MQKNWIGKSTGLLFSSPVKDMDLNLEKTIKDALANVDFEKIGQEVNEEMN